MKPVMQTKPGADGNCFHACLASVLEVGIADVPEWPDGPDWLEHVRRFLADKGLGMLALQVQAPEALAAVDGYFIVSGHTDGTVEHAVVVRQGRVVHDPHPNPTCKVRFDWLYVLYLLDPAKV